MEEKTVVDALDHLRCSQYYAFEYEILQEEIRCSSSIQAAREQSLKTVIIFQDRERQRLPSRRVHIVESETRE